MLTDDDTRSFKGAHIIDAERVERDGREVLRLQLASGGILAVEGDDLNVADETSIPWPQGTPVPPLND